MDGVAGTSRRDRFDAEAGFCRFYLAHGRPSCNVAAITRQCFGRQSVLALTYVDDVKREDGWRLNLRADPAFVAGNPQGLMVKTRLVERPCEMLHPTWINP